MGDRDGAAPAGVNRPALPATGAWPRTHAGTLECPGSRRCAVIVWTEHDGVPLLTAAAVVVFVAGMVFAIVGIPPVPIMWPVHRLGIVLPGCGLTRGVVAIARGDFGAALRWNPASYAIVVLGAAALARAAIGITTRRWLHVRIGLPWWLVGVIAIAAALLWVNQWSNAALLMESG